MDGSGRVRVHRVVGVRFVDGGSMKPQPPPAPLSPLPPPVAAAPPCTGEQRGRHLPLSRLLVHHKGGLVVDHEHAHLALHDAGEEALVHQQAVGAWSGVVGVLGRLCGVWVEVWVSYDWGKGNLLQPSAISRLVSHNPCPMPAPKPPAPSTPSTHPPLM